MSAGFQRWSHRCFHAACGALLASFMFASPAWAADEEVAAGSVAAAIREAGYPCAHVISMERAIEGAKEGFTVWQVRCNSGNFKVTFKGDTGSEVVPVD